MYSPVLKRNVCLYVTRLVMLLGTFPLAMCDVLPVRRAGDAANGLLHLLQPEDSQVSHCGSNIPVRGTPK